MNQPADASTLGGIHTLFATWCADLLAGKLKHTDSEGNETVIRPSAAELSVIRAFLKDNNITAAPVRGGALDKLREQLEARRKGSKLAASLPFNPETDLTGHMQ